MQQKSELFSEFSERTEELAKRLDVNVSDLPEIIGVSASMFHAYRSGKSPISLKAWRKLEAAEKAQSESGDTYLVKSAKNTPFPEAAGGEIAESYAKAKLSDVSEFTHSSSEKPLRRRRGERMIPVIGWAHAGDAESYEELPKSWQNEISSECPDPKAFAVSLEGDSMEPRFYDGDILIVQPTTEVHSGCFVVARFASDGVIFRRLEMRGSKIILVPLNSQYESSTHTADEFSWIYPVWARITKMWKK